MQPVTVAAVTPTTFTASAKNTILSAGVAVMSFLSGGNNGRPYTETKGQEFKSQV
jgi:hypothetical protein